jgi:transcriptional regulator with XRE-family HTH domain
MAKSFNELRAKMSPERRAANHKRTKQLLSEMPLHDLRKAMKLTQEQIAEELGISQAAVSKMEKRPDMYIKTLERFVQAMGGTLDVVAHFPNGEVKITGVTSSLEEIEA